MARINIKLANLTYIGRAKEFLETYDFPEDVVRSVVANPETIERDPRTAEVGYPVIRLRRGDITVVVGAENPEYPAVMYIYLHTPEQFGAGGSTSGGGSGSKLPTSTRQLRTWLMDIGCSLDSSGKGSHTKVYYRDRYLGVIAKTPSDNRSVANEYHLMRKRIGEVTADIVREQFSAMGDKS